MKGMLLMIVLTATPCWATTPLYIAQTAGTFAGGAACNGKTAIAPASWTSASPGDTVYLCGTWTGAANSTLLTVPGSGASGNPVTIIFDTGTVLQAPYFSASGYGINGGGHSYVTIDGGTNGIIQNTANGTALTYQAQSELVGGFGSNFQVKNLSMLNVYVHTTGDTGGGTSYAVHLAGQSNVTIGPGNTISSCDVGVFDDWTAAGNSNLTIEGNTFKNDNQDIEAGFYPAGTFTNVYIHGNTATGSWALWDNSSDTFHHNFVHLFTNLSGAVLAGDLQIYNNTVAGDMGSNATSLLYLENNNGGAGGSITATPYIFNNVLAKTNANVPTSTGIVSMLGVSNGYLLNNTISDAGGTGSDAYNCLNIYLTGWTVRNNIFEGCGSYIYQQQAGVTASNNDYYGAASPQWIYVSSYKTTLAAWQAACSCDASSLATTPGLTSAWTPSAASAVVGKGANLTSLGIAALDADAAGNARPASAAWDIGAYEYVSSTPDPPVITGIVVTGENE